MHCANGLGVPNQVCCPALQAGLDMGTCLPEINFATGRLVYRNKLTHRASAIAAAAHLGQVWVGEEVWQAADASLMANPSQVAGPETSPAAGNVLAIQASQMHKRTSSQVNAEAVGTAISAAAAQAAEAGGGAAVHGDANVRTAADQSTSLDTGAGHMSQPMAPHQRRSAGAAEQHSAPHPSRPLSTSETGTSCTGVAAYTTGIITINNPAAGPSNVAAPAAVQLPAVVGVDLGPMKVRGLPRTVRLVHCRWVGSYVPAPVLG